MWKLTYVCTVRVPTGLAPIVPGASTTPIRDPGDQAEAAPPDDCAGAGPPPPSARPQVGGANFPRATQLAKFLLFFFSREMSNTEV